MPKTFAHACLWCTRLLACSWLLYTCADISTCVHVLCAAVCLLCRDSLNQPLPVAAAANEQYKKAKGLGLGDADFAAVYEAGQLSDRSASPTS